MNQQGMSEQTTYLLEHFPVRKSAAQKAAFREWLAGALTAAGYTPRVEEGGFLVKSRNVVVGDPERAAVVFTAHYDTPARLPWPNCIVPKNYLFTILAQLPLIVPVFLLMGAAASAASALTNSSDLGAAAGWAALALAFWLMLAGPANPSNLNDNTSGVAAVLEIALALPKEQRDRAAFVFFDNEEKGLLGSAQFKRAHGKKMADTLVVNFDCVSDGDHICFFPSWRLKKRHHLLELLEAGFLSQEGKTVEVVRGFGFYPSDHKRFRLGVGVAALRRGPLGFYIGRIHTRRDTVFQAENISLLRRGAPAFLTSLEERRTAEQSRLETAAVPRESARRSIH